MLNAKLLRKIKDKNPEYSQEEIRLVISKHLSILNRKLVNCQKLNLVIPKLGRIHTHGNVINKSKKLRNKRQIKTKKKERDYSLNTLLF